MKKTFDPKQQSVLDCTENKQLVSAGAGSGKTTVMIRKIADLILQETVKPSEIIVLTFTVLASKEMKQRLISILNEELYNASTQESKEKITRILYELETASIDTIDGFCSKMCKKYFYAINLLPETSIATGLSQDYFVETAINATIKEALSVNQDEVIALSDCFEKNARNLDALKKNILNTFNFIMAQKDYDKFLTMAENEYEGLYNSANFLNNHLVKTLHKHLFEIEILLPSISACETIHTSLTSYISVLKNIKINSSLIENVNYFQMLPTIRFTKVKDEYQNTISIIKYHFNIIKDTIDEFKFLQHFKIETIHNEHFSVFIKLLKMFIRNYENVKTKNNVVDFLDLERKFLQLINIDSIKQEFFSTYKYIFVDEYQDINPMQDEIINCLKSNTAKIFFVGDIKQSIYGFRQSTPELFLEKYKSYQKEHDSKSFDMNINFRSNPSILNFNNEVFSKLMTEENADIDYKNDAQFEAKREDFPQSATDVEIAIFNSEAKQDIVESGIYSVFNSKNTQHVDSSEVNFVVDKILQLVGSPFYDSNRKEMRNLEYSDIAILSRSLSDSKTKQLVHMLQSHNVPVNIVNKTPIRECESVYLIYNILKVINNNADDVALLTYLTTNLGQISLEEIYFATYDKNGSLQDKLLSYISSSKNELANKLKYAFNLIDEIRYASLTCNNLELINLLLNNYHLKYYILNSANGQAEFDTLTKFLSTLSNRETDSNLTSFLRFLKNNLDSPTESNILEGNNTVTIQTIHASKGLEYPIVILFNASKSFKPNNYRDDINFDTEQGIGMHYYDLISRKKYESIPRFAISLKNKIKCYKEELRLLYVATTRPKNRLIITGSAKFSKLEEKELNSNNYLELIYSVFADKITSLDECKMKHCTIYHYSDYKISSKAKTTTHNTSISVAGKNVDFIYPYEQLTHISLKNNVTALSRELNDEYNILPHKLDVSENIHATPPQSAEIGTQYHNALSKLDFNSSYVSIAPQLDETILRKAHAKIADLAKDSIKIYQELPFMMYIPYNEIYLDSPITEKVLVQGVIDLMIEFGDHIILVDYKYSNSNIHTLKNRYATQLRLYALAIEKAKHKKVTNSYIYKINSGELA